MIRVSLLETRVFLMPLFCCFERISQICRIEFALSLRQIAIRSVIEALNLGVDQIPTLISFSAYFRPNNVLIFFSVIVVLFYSFEKLWRPWTWPSRSLKNFPRKQKSFSFSITCHISYRSVTKHCARLQILHQN